MAKKLVTPLESMAAWNRLGLQWMEMMAGSQSVIARRTSRGPTPLRLHAMVSEKAEAALASSNAMARVAMRAPPTTVPGMWLAWAEILSSGMAPFSARVRANTRHRR